MTLAKNNLRVIPSLAAQPSRLISLDLRHNEIATVDVQAFSYTPSLIQLDLAHNRLQSLPQMIFTKNNRIATLKLHRNPWNCDCRILAIIRRITKQNSKFGEEAKCFNPSRLRGTSLISLKPGMALCFNATVTETEFHSVLDCTAIGGGEVHCGIDLDFSSADSYQLKENGSLIVPEKSAVHKFTCTADYAALPTR
uniref:LRRCT domain-containing protein n=1 Tax=Angiostrongylus cantonensis TaxID=6313 RepID=A0A0K0DFI4_ANGCA